MRFRLPRVFIPIGMVFVMIAAACSDSNSPGPTNVSLKGTYILQSFTQAGQDLSSVSTGTAVLTDTTYVVHIIFAGGVAQPIIDSGTYVAKSNGTFSETSAVTGAQATGTFTDTNGVWTVNVTSQGVPIQQTWIKQP